MTKQAKKTYQQIKSELEEVLLLLQNDSLDIDKALELHASGEKLIKELQKYLESTKHRFEIIKKQAK